MTVLCKNLLKKVQIFVPSYNLYVVNDYFHCKLHNDSESLLYGTVPYANFIDIFF